MGFRLVPKSVTLNDLERGLMAVILLYSTEFGSLVGHLRKKWLKIYPHCLRLKNVVQRI